jgi:hypothetical protein|uniref:Uncharacterized protein n=1 Tax=Leptospirillum ferriphilum TaxID=178606 RepID=A0A7C3LUB4_9BACT
MIPWSVVLDKRAFAHGVLRLSDYLICPVCLSKRTPEEWAGIRSFGMCAICAYQKRRVNPYLLVGSVKMPVLLRTGLDRVFSGKRKPDRPA